MSTTALFVISLISAAASLVISVIAAVKAKNAIVAVGEEDSLTVNDINNTQQSEGLVVPIVYGNGLICGNTIWWRSQYGGLTEQYSIILWQTLCMGHIQTGGDIGYTKGKYFNVFMDAKILDYYPESGGSDASDWYERLIVSDGDPTAGTKIPDRYLPVFPDYGAYVSRLKGVAYVFITWFDLPPGVTNVPTFKFRVFADKSFFFVGNGNWKPNTFPHSSAPGYGVNPATVIYDLLTNVQYGLGLAEASINWNSFVNASNYFHKQLYYLNFVINQSVSVRDIIVKIQDWCEGFLIKNESDEYELIYFQDSDADNPQAIVTDDDMIEFSLRRKSWNDTFNSFTANFTHIYRAGDRIPSFFEKKTASIKNEANIQMTGSVRNKVIDLVSFINLEGVNNRLTQIMKKESYPFATASLSVNLKYSFLRRGDVLTINSDEYNFIGPFRITDIVVNETDKTKLDFELIQLRELVADDISDPTSRADGIYTEAELVPCAFTLTFPAFSAVSEACPRAFIVDADSKVAWSSGQTLKGVLTYGTDYVIDDHNKIHLNEVIYADEIMMNSEGLLSVDIYEPGCPSPPTES